MTNSKDEHACHGRSRLDVSSDDVAAEPARWCRLHSQTYGFDVKFDRGSLCKLDGRIVCLQRHAVFMIACSRCKYHRVIVYTIATDVASITATALVIVYTILTVEAAITATALVIVYTIATVEASITATALVIKVRRSV